MKAKFGVSMTSANPPSTSRKLFLTGASGVVGQALLKRLPGDRVVCLAHRQPVSAPGVETVQGDVRERRFGLAEEAYRALADGVGCVVHSAANTKFSRRADDIFATNVGGTENALALAQAAGAPFYFVSTAFVRPLRSLAGPAVSNAYEESKRRAEEVVRTSGHPATIVRPSVIVGDSETGQTDEYQGFHQILDLVLRRQIPILPGAAEGYIDFVPKDVVADFIVGLVRAGVVDGDYWLTAGTRAPRLLHLLELAVASASRANGRPIPVPRLVAPASFERLLRAPRRNGRPVTRRPDLQQLSSYVKYLSIIEPLPTSLNFLSYDLEQTFLSNVRYWCARNNGLSMEAARAGAA